MITIYFYSASCKDLKIHNIIKKFEKESNRLRYKDKKYMNIEHSFWNDSLSMFVCGVQITGMHPFLNISCKQHLSSSKLDIQQDNPGIQVFLIQA